MEGGLWDVKLLEGADVMRGVVLLEMVLLSFGRLGLWRRHWCLGWARSRLWMGWERRPLWIMALRKSDMSWRNIYGKSQSMLPNSDEHVTS